MIPGPGLQFSIVIFPDHTCFPLMSKDNMLASVLLNLSKKVSDLRLAEHFIAFSQYV